MASIYTTPLYRTSPRQPRVCSSCWFYCTYRIKPPCLRCCTNEINKLIEESVTEGPAPYNMIPTLDTPLCFCNIYLPWSETDVPYISDALDSQFVDTNLLCYLVAKKAINWCDSLRPMYPVSTTGDGNCLLHAVSIAMWGIHDCSLLLRRLLYVALVQCEDQLKPRWKNERKWLNKQVPEGGLHYSNKEWEQEWSVIVQAAQDLRRDSVRHTANRWAFELPYESLEEIHVFALANIIRRPIVVLGDPHVHSPYGGEVICNNNFVGIYLPLLWPPKCCVKTPIVLAFVLEHFVPLVCKGRPTLSRRARLGANSKSADKHPYSSDYKDADVETGKSRTPWSTKAGSVMESSKQQRTCVPLVTHDLQPLRLHFLVPSEADDNDALLHMYLTMVDVRQKMHFDTLVPETPFDGHGIDTESRDVIHDVRRQYADTRNADDAIKPGPGDIHTEYSDSSATDSPFRDSHQTQGTITNTGIVNLPTDTMILPITCPSPATDPVVNETRQTLIAEGANTAPLASKTHPMRTVSVDDYEVNLDQDDWSDSDTYDDPETISVAIPAAAIRYCYIDPEYDYIYQSTLYYYERFSRSSRRSLYVAVFGFMRLVKRVRQHESNKRKRDTLIKLYNAWWSAANTWRGKTLVYARYW